MADEAMSVGVKYRSVALRSLQKEILEIEKSLAVSEESHEEGLVGENGSDDETDGSLSASQIFLHSFDGRDNDSLSLSFSMKTSEFASLTEAERLEKQVERLEKRIEEAEERMEQRGRTKKQRQADRQAIERMNAKLDKLQRRIQLEASGRKNWSLIRKEVKRPAFGLNTFSSVDFLRRKKALAEAEANFLQRRAPRLTTIVEQAVAKNIEDKLRAKRALLQGRKIEKAEDEDVWVQLGIRGAKELDPAIKEEFDAQRKDEREFQNGWLRISDIREDFMKCIGFYPEEDNRGVTARQRHMWQKYADGGETRTDASKFEILSPVARPRSNLKRSPIQSAGRRSCATSARRHASASGKQLQRSAPNETATPRTPRVKRQPAESRKSLTTSFLPNIPLPEAKRRPPTSEIEKVKDERDEMLRRERIRLIPNRRRVAENRARLFLTQMDFAKTHKLSSRRIVEELRYAIEECGQPLDTFIAEQPGPTAREKLHLIGALSRDHVEPLGMKAGIKAK